MVLVFWFILFYDTYHGANRLFSWQIIDYINNYIMTNLNLVFDVMDAK